MACSALELTSKVLDLVPLSESLTHLTSVSELGLISQDMEPGPQGFSV